MNIGITGTGSLIGQGIIKCIKASSLKDRVNLTGLDYIPDTIGSFWCDQNYILPDIFKGQAKEEEWLTEVYRIIRAHKLEMLLIGIDFELPVFAKLKSQIEEETGCIIVVSDSEVVEIANDKYLTAEFLRKNNLPYPMSFLPEDYHQGTLEFPMVVKPRVGASSIGFNIVRNEKELAKALNEVHDPVIQEYIGDNQSEYTCGVIYLDGKIHGKIALLRTLKRGDTNMAVYTGDTPEIIYEYIDNVANALKPYGVVNFQLRLNKERKPVLFEINPRHSGTTYMRSLFGYNEVEYIISYLLEGKITDITRLKEGKAMRFFDEFFKPL